MFAELVSFGSVSQAGFQVRLCRHTLGMCLGQGDAGAAFGSGCSSGAEADTEVLQPSAARGTFIPAGFAGVLGTPALPVPPR